MAVIALQRNTPYRNVVSSLQRNCVYIHSQENTDMQLRNTTRIVLKAKKIPSRIVLSHR